jgi:hypothetical protein
MDLPAPRVQQMSMENVSGSFKFLSFVSRCKKRCFCFAAYDLFVSKLQRPLIPAAAAAAVASSWFSCATEQILISWNGKHY